MQLEQEIERLETRLTGAAAGELATVRAGLASCDAKPAVQLENIRIGFPCKERWEDMVGDDRVRACAGCDRPVFNLSEMTRAEAQAVLATRGLTPCVRMYRRPDGTVMTSDCPKSERPPSRKLAVVASSLAVAGAASPTMAQPADAPVDAPADAPADPTATPQQTITIDQDYIQGLPVQQTFTVVMGGIALEPLEVEVAPEPPRVEWSLWGRLGTGFTSQRPDAIARRVTTEPAMAESDAMTELAATAELTFGVARHGKLRLGVFGEVRTSSDPVAGGELIVHGLPPHPLESRIHGSGSLVLRAGGNGSVMTGAIGFGYVGARSRSRSSMPWARHLVGARLLVSMNRALADPRDWSATVGLEVEPIGLARSVIDVVRDR